MHGLIFETSIWPLAGSTRSVLFFKQLGPTGARDVRCKRPERVFIKRFFFACCSLPIHRVQCKGFDSIESFFRRVLTRVLQVIVPYPMQWSKRRVVKGLVPVEIEFLFRLIHIHNTFVAFNLASSRASCLECLRSSPRIRACLFSSS